ncbi:PAS domain S-box protein [Methylobacterium sp. J-078]|uniref:PAS domain-containing hybrid sensor histidine kinase/response regulator n=1 Tax=Methylobacterium sp. J-078 TaxID=2836657 RepID=UPI001FB9D823|nr:PAS domain S-box protein [Methylobacterium sp. J-078]MCJ2047838.1 PAS domain S-box protein [Methylobacterium sp. J-078]
MASLPAWGPAWRDPGAEGVTPGAIPTPAELVDPIAALKEGAGGVDLALVSVALALVGLVLIGIRIGRRRRQNAIARRSAHEAQTLLRDLFEASADRQFIFHVKPPADFRLANWNPAAAAASGKGDEALGRPVDAVLPPIQAARMRTALARTLVSGKTVRLEDHAEGSFFEAVHVPLRDPVTRAIDRVYVGIHDISHLKLAEAEAREANRLLVLAEQVAHVGHWDLQLQARRLTWSDEVYRIHGLDPATFTPTIRNSLAAYHPDDRASARAIVTRAIRRREGFDIALRLVRPSGEVRDVLVRGLCQFEHGSAGRLGSPRSIFGVVADVTEVKQAERALADKSALLEATLESMDQGLLLIGADGSVPVINRRAVEILSLPAALMARQPDYRAIRLHLRESGAWGTSIQDPRHWLLDENRRTTDLRSERRRQDGSVIEVRSLPMHTGQGHVQTLTDITHRRRSEERLRESEARFRLLADYTSDLIVLDDAAGRHRYISPAVTSMLGYSAEEADAIGLRTLVHGEDGANLDATLRALGAEQPTGSAIYRMRRKAGSWIWVEAAFRRIEDTNGIQIIQAIRDVSDRQTQEADLKSARAAAEAGARAKAEFLANMSHELRTPLAGILGVHDLLREDATLTRDQARLVGLARESGRSLLTIVNDILDFSKIEAGHLTIEALPFSLLALIEGCRELSAETLQDRPVAFSIAIAPDVPDWVLGDPTRLRQVILNLITNAIKFTPQGTVTLRASWLRDPAENRRSRARLRIELVDTGIGILPETLPHLFERFAQADGSTSRKYGGTGLGLTICRRLVQLMGGEIGVESRFGAGSTFWFEVPLRLAEAESAAEDRSSSLLQATAGAAWRVLLAEDNAINQEIIGTVLRQKGHAVTVVEDGERAVAAALDQGPLDLVLMDVQMPGQDGLAATRAIRARERAEGRGRLPIIALTANAMSEEIERCHAAGMDAHVAKPVDWSVLFKTMERLAREPGSDDARGAAAATR